MYRLEGTSIGIFEPQGSNASYHKVKSVTHEGSEVSRKYINEDIKENINIDTHYEPEQPEGSGSSGISDQERKKAGDIISKTILEAMN